MSKTPPPSDLELLRAHAEELWERQQEVFAQAARVAREAGRQGASYARDEVGPRVGRVVSSGANTVRSRVLPAVSSGLATAVALGDRGVREALAGIARARAGAATPTVVVAAPKRGLGIGGWIGVGVGLLAAGAVAYAVWQTLRADDDLWVEDDELPSDD